MSRKLKAFAALVAVYVSSFSPALAQGSGVGASGTGAGSRTEFALINPLDPRFSTLERFLSAILGVIVEIGTPIIILAIVYTGFLFVAAQGKPEELTTAKRALFWTLVGALIVLGAQVLSAAIDRTVDDIRRSHAPDPVLIVKR